MSSCRTLHLVLESHIYYYFPPSFFNSNENQEAFETWTRHDDMQDNFCELDGEIAFDFLVFVSFIETYLSS